MNNIDSSLTNTNDSILTHTQTPQYLMQQGNISYQRTDFKKVFFEYFVNFCYILISLTFSGILIMYFLRLCIHIHLVLRFAFLFINIIFFTFFFWLYPGVS